jgi:protein-tyrosine phosphatase
MIDIHCHVLPGVDDGARDWDTAVEMCKIARQDGITHIVATPHCNDQYPYDREAHQDRLNQLRQRVPDLEFTLGCDFHASFENIQSAAQHPDRYTIGTSPYLLVEFSDYQTPAQMSDLVFRLQSAGLRLIITHPERNPVISQFPDFPAQLVDLGCLLQITADALTGAWGNKIKKTCESMLKKELVSFIASDAHGTGRRKPSLSEAGKAAARIIGREAADQLVQSNPGTVIGSQRAVDRHALAARI